MPSRRITVLYIGFLLVLASTSACAPVQPTPEPTVEPSRTATNTVTPVPASVTPTARPTSTPKPGGTIQVWAWESFYDNLKGAGILDDFSKDFPELRVEWTILGQKEIADRLPDLNDTGLPDVALIDNSFLPDVVAGGIAADLTERVRPYMDYFRRALWAPGERVGRFYALPVESRPMVLFYRRDVLAKAGLPTDPQKVDALVGTWEDLLAVCQTIREKGSSPCFASNKANNTGQFYVMMLSQQGLGLYGDQGEFSLDAVENSATMEVLGKFWQNDVVSDQGEWTDGWDEELANADAGVAFVFGSPGVARDLSVWMAPELAGKWGVARIPAMKAGRPRSAGGGGASWVVSAHSHFEDGAWAFIQYVSTREKSQKELAARGEIFPAFDPAYQDPLFAQPDPFFGGQDIRSIFVEAAKSVPENRIYGVQGDAIRRLVARAVQNYALRRMSARKALQDAAEQASKLAVP